MNDSLARLLKRSLFPLRVTLRRLVMLPEDSLLNSITYKAGCIVAAEKIDGDYLEFGVYRGTSFISAYRSIELAFRNLSTPNLWTTDEDGTERRAIWSKMRFFAFDSFQGLPPLQGVDRHTREFVEGKYRCSRDDFVRNLRKAGVPLDRVVIVPGWFEETLNQATLERCAVTAAAIVHIDSDLYESARAILKFITPLLTDGTVIIFDDWYCYRGNPQHGEQRACREWLEENENLRLSEYQKEGPWRNSFIVSRKIDGGARGAR